GRLLEPPGAEIHRNSKVESRTLNLCNGRRTIQTRNDSMNFQFTNPAWLALLAAALPWTFWLAWKSDVQVSAWRRWSAFSIRLIVILAVTFAIAGLQWLRPIEGMNVFYLLDRSDSIPSPQQEAALRFLNQTVAQK